MEPRNDETPFAREPWQRLLGESDDGPPETTDARIRAAARRDLAPRGRRWWLPASLAASFVLAVMIVQSEFGTIRRPLVRESAVHADSAMEARLIERGAGPEAREAGESPAAPAPQAKRTEERAETDAYGYLDAETGTEDAGVGPRLGGPEHEIQAASELPDEVTASAEPRQDSPAAAAAASGVARLAEPPSPEAWYAQIRKLFAEGRRADAERELAALRKAYPEWAAEHVKAEHLR